MIAKKRYGPCMQLALITAVVEILCPTSNGHKICNLENEGKLTNYIDPERSVY